jgi:hypothetical protein
LNQYSTVCGKCQSREGAKRGEEVINTKVEGMSEMGVFIRGEMEDWHSKSRKRFTII